MNIHLSSATIQSYENKNKTMDLFYNPIVIFEDIKPLDLEQLKDVKWFIISDKIASHEFDIQSLQIPSLEVDESTCFLEFRLSKKDVPFMKDNYSCKIVFESIFETEQKEEKIVHEVLAVVKTKWSKGLL